MATDAAFAYDAAYRLFGLKLDQKQVSAPTLNNDGKSDPFESDEANFVFNWLTYPDDAMMEVESPERMNFTCPSNYRAKRSEELASRLIASPQDQNVKDVGIISEADLVAKVRKEIVSIAKLAAAICPVQKMFGKRACDLMFDELPEVEVRSRKRSRKPSREYLIKHQYVQQQQQQQQQPNQPNATSNTSLQQMLLHQQMYGQAMMGSRIGYGNMNNMFGSLPMNSMASPPATAIQNNLLGFPPRDLATMPNGSVSSTSSSVANTGMHSAPGSSFDPQLLYMMMQQNMPQHSNMRSFNEQLLNRQPQPEMPQGNMPINGPSQANTSLINNGQSSTGVPPPQPASQNKQGNGNQALLLPSRNSPSSETKL